MSASRAASQSSGELITLKDAKNLARCAFGREVEVLDYGLRPYCEEKIGFLGSHQLLKLKVKLSEDENRVTSRSTSFFVKTLPYEVPSQAEYVKEKGVFDQEVAFFKDVVPELRESFACEPWAPECFLTKDDCLVFEDLQNQGFFIGKKLLEEDEIRAGLGALARLHAASLHVEARLGGKPLNEIHPKAFQERAFAKEGKVRSWYEAGVDLAVRVAEELSLDASRIPEACERIFEAIKPSRLKQNVASHGDLWANNLMFDESQPMRCRLVDFQLARYAPLGHDVAQFLHLCASRAFRERREEEMLGFYYQTVRACLLKNSRIAVRCPSWREVKLAYEEQRLGAVITAAIYFPTVLLDGQLGAKIMNDSESYERFVFVDRREPVLENMKRDSEYRERLEDAVRELVRMSEVLEELPEPC